MGLTWVVKLFPVLFRLGTETQEVRPVDQIEVP
jgi:hypothetical protein